MLDRIIGSYLAELAFYLLIWGILLPICVILASPFFLVHALLHPSTSLETLARDYRGLFRWWLGHFPFPARPRVPADPDDMTRGGRRHDAAG